VPVTVEKSPPSIAYSPPLILMGLDELIPVTLTELDVIFVANGCAVLCSKLKASGEVSIGIVGSLFPLRYYWY